MILCLFLLIPVQAAAQNETLTLLIQKYEDYQESFLSLKTLEDVEGSRFDRIEDQSFPVVFETFGQEEVTFVPVIDREYHRLAILIADSEGKILYKTDQLEANYKFPGQLEQPVKGIAAVSFQDENRDGLTDIVLITDCENRSGDYAGNAYKIGEVLFQEDGQFYRDWRISDKINRYSMNKSVDFITAYVRDGNSTEALYTAKTLEELLENGFQITEELCYTRNFEMQGRLKVVPGIISMAEYDIFMIYLVNDQGLIVWSFQPMGDYDNLYALKGITCRDLDGDGMKDILVLARYSYAGPNGKLMIDTKCSIYYQRADGFAEDEGFAEEYQCTEADTVGGLVEIIREYWGWPKEE